VILAARGGERREVSQPAPGIDQLEPEGTAGGDVLLDSGDQHGDTSGHGWASSPSIPRSTFA